MNTQEFTKTAINLITKEGLTEEQAEGITLGALSLIESDITKIVQQKEFLYEQEEEIENFAFKNRFEEKVSSVSDEPKCSISSSCSYKNSFC